MAVRRAAAEQKGTSTVAHGAAPHAVLRRLFAMNA